MSKITFITFNNNFCVGVNILTSILIESGHDVSLIFFKLPIKHPVKWFSQKTTDFLEMVDSYGNIISGSQVVNKYTDYEVNLLIEKLKDLSPEIICFNSRTTDNNLAIDICPKIREKIDAISLAGGFGPSLNPEIYADLVDYVFVGEAENSIKELVSRI